MKASSRMTTFLVGPGYGYWYGGNKKCESNANNPVGVRTAYGEISSLVSESPGGGRDDSQSFVFLAVQ